MSEQFHGGSTESQTCPECKARSVPRRKPKRATRSRSCDRPAVPFSALNSALNRWDAVKWRIWKAVGYTEWQRCDDETFRRVCVALATIGRTGSGADVSASDLELFVGRPLVAEAMEKADIVIKLAELCGVGKEHRRALRDIRDQDHWRGVTFTKL